VMWLPPVAPTVPTLNAALAGNVNNRAVAGLL
jgi:hypothetical protein